MTPSVGDGPRTLTVTWARTRMAKAAYRREFSWPLLCARLSKVARTAETYSQYMAMPVSQQLALKDAGWWNGSTFADDRRSNATWQSSDLLLLDLDHMSAAGMKALLATLQMVLPWTWCLHSTRKHNAHAPRLRLAMPFAKPVTDPDAYCAVGRHVASLLGIDQFDPTSFQHARAMFWPTASSDGDWFFEFQDGEWLDTDAVLEAWPGPAGWRDVATWPRCKSEADVPTAKRKRIASGQAMDPRDNAGLVGAFCRAWPIDEAMAELLDSVYEPFGEGRWTYTKGTTCGGACTYDGLWLYSHHSTDPAMGHLWNAFDAVRIHRFGQLDAESKDGTAVSALPSTKAMLAWVGSEPRTCAMLDADLIAGMPGGEAAAAPAAPASLSDEDKAALLGIPVEEMRRLDASIETSDALVNELPTEKRRTLQRAPNGNILGTRENLDIILTEHPEFKDALKYNIFTQGFSCIRKMPWSKRKLPDDPLGLGKAWSDADLSGLLRYLERFRQEGWPKEMVRDSLASLEESHAWSWGEEWLKKLKWDGVPRVARFCTDYLRADAATTDPAYLAAVGEYIWSGMAGRLASPGCQADMMPVLVGPQGLGKSSALQVMALDRRLYASTTFASKDEVFSRKIVGKLVVDVSELRGMRNRDVETIRERVTRRDEQWRRLYHEYESLYPRHCLLFATTNSEEFLSDPDGNRRYLPIPCGTCDIEKLRNDVLQLWAEGYAIWASRGIQWKEAERLARGVHERYEVYVEDTGSVTTWLTENIENKIDPDRAFRLCELLDALGYPRSQHRAVEQSVSSILKRMGYRSKRAKGNGVRVWSRA